MRFESTVCPRDRDPRPLQHASRRRHRRYVRPGNRALARSQRARTPPVAAAPRCRGDRARGNRSRNRFFVFWFPVSESGIRGRTRAGLARFLCVSARMRASAPRAGGRASRSNPERSDSTRHPKSAQARRASTLTDDPSPPPSTTKTRRSRPSRDEKTNIPVSA
jgi:hypothetical protein